MTDTAISGHRRRSGGWSFYTTMALVIAGVVAWGFVPTYTAGLAPPGLPIWVHIHGAVMTGWILLFVLQSQLIQMRSLPLHRALGTASIGLVVVMVPLGLATDLLAIQRDAVPPFFTPVGVLSADLCDLLMFVGLYVAAVAMRGRPEWHKRLLLGGTVLLAWPAIGRLHPLWAWGLGMIIPLSIAVLIALTLLGPIQDWITRRRVHPAYWWSVGGAVILWPLYTALAAAPPLQAIANSVLPG